MDRPEERVALIECLERDGRPGRSIDVVAWPLTLGRGLANHVVLDDPHVAARHARIEPDPERGLVLRVLDTTNGVTVEGRHHAARAVCPLPVGGAMLQLGHTRLRLRLAGEVLAAEQPLPVASGKALLLVLPLIALMLAKQALRMDPGDELTTWLPSLLTWPIGLAGWCLTWALMSKVFQHRFDFMGHLRIALPWFLAIQVAGVLLPQAGASLGWTWLWRSLGPVQVVLGALWLMAQLAHLLPAHRRAVATAVTAAAVAASAVWLIFVQRETDSYSRAPYMSTLPVAALRLSDTVAPALLVDDVAKLAEPLAHRVKKARDEEDGVDDDE